MSYTINPNAKNKWARNAENTMDLSLETDASSVYLDNGRTLEQEIGEGSMVSNVTTVDSAMSKIIDGTLDGAYESGVMYGRSLVNLSNLHKSFNDVTLSDYYIDTSLCETSKLKLGTPYTLVFYTTVHGGDHDIYTTIELGVGDALHATHGHPKTTTNKYQGTLVKNGWSKVCITFTDFLGYKYLSLRPIRCAAPESGKSIRFSIEGFILLEGDWSNKDLPFNDYFEGLCDVKMPILHNVGKNLFNPSLLLESETRFGITKNVVGETIVLNGTSSQNHDLHFTPNDNKTGIVVKKGKFYKLTIHCLGGTSTPVLNPAVKLTLKDGTIKWLSSNIDLRDSNCDGLLTWFRICPQEGNSFSNYQIKLQLEESSTSTSYEPYKTNILRTPEIVTLRSLPSGVRDELNLMTGEYIKRIGEIVLDGSQSMDADSNGVFVQVNDAKRFLNYTGKMACDKLPIMPTYGHLANVENGISGYTNANGYLGQNWLYIKINNSINKNEVKQWLTQNPLTVQYELGEPIITIVESLTTPFAYENGHVILESGYEGQSLLPTLEYSTVVNKTGLVENVAKTIQRQEKQLTMLEKMLIQNIINLDYNNTLLTLKNEMEEML